MPLLGKEEFTLKTLPSDLDPDEEVFYCSITGEAFQTYDEYFERQILCSSLLWTCSVTGKTGLTYADALKSENESQTLLSSIPRLLQKVLLHLMNYLDNFSTNVAISILLEYTNLRYFIGENVQILYKNKGRRVNGLIRDVLPPENIQNSISIAYGLDPLEYNYVVEIFENNKNSDNTNSVEVIPSARISRSKCSLTREKIRLFLKQHLSPKTSRYETLSIKSESIHKFGLHNLKWEDIFKGPTPNFNCDTTIVKAFNKDRQPDSNDDSLQKADNDSSIQVLKKKSNILSAQKLKLKEREEKYKSSPSQETSEKKKGKKSLKKDILKKLKMKTKTGKPGRKKSKNSAQDENVVKEPKLSKIEEKNREKETRRKFEEDTRTWMEKRDDLLCDDLKPLPPPTSFDCNIESNLISDSLLIIEFINVFQDYIAFENNFPMPISVDMFSNILQDKDSTGYYGDLLISLLNTILMSNKDDSESEFECDLKITENDEYDTLNLIGEDDDSNNNSNINFANHWVATYFATHEQLSKLKLDSFTLSEILRLYVLKARNGDTKRANKLCDADISLTTKLLTFTVFDLEQFEKIHLINLLLNDILKIPLVRQKIETSMEEMFRLKTQIRHLNASYTKWLRDNPIRQRMRKKKQTTDSNNELNSNVKQTENETSKDEKEQYKREKTQKEQQMKKTIFELKAKIRKLSAFCRSRPLGSDRAYRKYWIFQSIPGLLIEHSVGEIQTRPCLQCPVPMDKPQLTDYLPNAKRRKRKKLNKEEVHMNSDKENDNENKNLNNGSNVESETLQLGIFDRCTGEQSTCSVHGMANTTQSVRWFFYTKEQLDELIDSLNLRGFRENELRNALCIEKQSILKNHLENFIPTILNPNYIPPVTSCVSQEDNYDTLLVRKSSRIQNQLQDKSDSTRLEFVPFQPKSATKYSKFSPNDAHVVAFQDELMFLEDKIFNSCFSSFKLDDRDEWYKNVAMDYSNDRIKLIDNLTILFKSLAKSLRPFCLLPPLSVYPESSASSPSDKENIESIQIPKLKVPMLSEKWLDVLKVPEGLLLSNKDTNDFDSTYGITNYSQLFLNLYILDKSINWDLSALKTATKCRICRRKANDEMILCDMCNRGYHIYCLNPPIASIDEIEGDWFCYTCFPRTKVSAKNSLSKESLSKVPEINNQSIDSIEDEKKVENITDEIVEQNFYDNCFVCKKQVRDEYSEIVCKTCSKSYHLKCVNLVRVPRSWACLPCEAKERYAQKYNPPNATADDNSDLRRSTRKRKPNIHYDFDAIDENSFYGNNTTTKNRRYSDYDEECENINLRKSSRRLGNDKIITNQVNPIELST